MTDTPSTSKCGRKDVWTLNPGFNFGRSGGKNEANIHVAGRQPARHRAQGRGRVGHQRRQHGVDGQLPRPALHRELHAPGRLLQRRRRRLHQVPERRAPVLRARHAVGCRFALIDTTFDDDRYELGKKVGEFRAHDQYYEAERRLVARPGGRLGHAAGPWARPGPGAVRAGAQHVARRSVAPDRKFVYPWLGFELRAGRVQETHQPGPDRTHRGRAGRSSWLGAPRLRERVPGLED